MFFYFNNIPVAGHVGSGTRAESELYQTPACSACVRSDTHGQDRSKLYWSTLCCGLQLPADRLEGGDTIQTHRVHCTVAVTVSTALPSPW